MSHTPGPWEVAEAGSWTDGKRSPTEYFVHRPSDDVGIASDIIDPETSQPSEANARLIAAAPDLLESMQEYFIIWANKGKVNGWCKRVDEARCKINAAIAKATGKEPS